MRFNSAFKGLNRQVCPDLQQLHKGFLFSASCTFDSVGRGIISAFTNDIDVKYCHFDPCVVPAAWLDFVSCSFFSSLRYISPKVSHVFCVCLPERNSFLATDCYRLSRHIFTIFQYNDVGLRRFLTALKTFTNLFCSF